MLASVAAVGVTKDNNWAIVVIILDIGSKLGKLGLTSLNIFATIAGIHVKYIYVYSNACSKGHGIYTETLVDKAIGTIACFSIVSIPCNLSATFHCIEL